MSIEGRSGKIFLKDPTQNSIENRASSFPSQALMRNALIICKFRANFLIQSIVELNQSVTEMHHFVKTLCITSNRVKLPHEATTCGKIAIN